MVNYKRLENITLYSQGLPEELPIFQNSTYMLFINGDTPGSSVQEFWVSPGGNAICFSLAIEESSFQSHLSINVSGHLSQSLRKIQACLNRKKSASFR